MQSKLSKRHFFGITPLLLKIAVLVMAPLAYAGQSSHGTDNKNGATGSVWFLGANKAAKYCVDIDRGFGVERVVVEEELRNIFQDWKLYIEKKVPVREINANHSAHGFTTNFNLQSCDGTEDLKFFLGTESEAIQEEIRRFDNPAAFAVRSTYDESAGWSSGYVWVSKPKAFTFEVGFHLPQKTLQVDWREPFLLRAILMHEVGHLFGVDHVAGTIMDEQVLRRILAPKLYPLDCPNSSPFFARIDNEKDLIPCVACDAEGRPETWSGSIPLQSLDILADLLGREISGDAKASVILHPNGSYALSIQTDEEQLTLPLVRKEGTPKVSVVLDSTKIFRIYFREADGYKEGFFSQKIQGEQELLLTIGTRTFAVLLMRNSLHERSPMVLRWDMSKKNPLFAAASSYASDGCEVPDGLMKPFWML